MDSERGRGDGGPRPGDRSWGSKSTGVDWHARRPLVVALTVAGAAVSAYLALYQLDIARGPWDPIFGSGTDRVLHSSFARTLPIPDTVVGAAAYLLEGILATFALRPGSRRPVVIVFGLLGLAMAATGLFLIGVQALVVHSWCSLCLVSAAVSLLVGALAARELWKAAGALLAGRADDRGRPAAG